MPHAGPTIGYRPIPSDFVEIFLRVGWDGIEQEMRAHKKTIKRCIEVIDATPGSQPLRDRRREYLERRYAEQKGGRRIPGRLPAMPLRQGRAAD